MSRKHRRVVKRFSWFFFVLYLIAMAYFLFFSEYLNRSGFGAEYRYNLELFKEVKRSFWCYRHGMQNYFFLNFVLNIVAFVPFGFFLPFLSKNAKRRELFYVIFSALQFTLSIEIVQLILKVGTFDVDDILLNTAGGLIGFLLFKIAQFIWSVIRKEIKE